MIINNNSGVRCLPKRFIWPRAAVASVYFLPVFLVVSVSFFQKGWKIFTVVECYTLGATPGSVFQSSWSFFCLRNEGNSVITRGIRFFSPWKPNILTLKTEILTKIDFFFCKFWPQKPKIFDRNGLFVDKLTHKLTYFNLNNQNCDKKMDFFVILTYKWTNIGNFDLKNPIMW